ncbi:MAG: aminopeptidase P N-terminal domain-containing protein [Phycisphaerae bacterium]|nr:aminopeptidase P N-terminal domain-containing protein [Phycisphaerae bacterium]
MKTSPTLAMTAPPVVYRERRKRLAAKLRRPMVVPAGFAPARNYPGNPYPFRAGSTYLYLGGPPIEGAAWVVESGSDGDAGCTLLRPPPDPDDALWFGKLPTDVELAEAAGLADSRVIDIDRFGSRRSDLVACHISPSCVRSLKWVAGLGLKPAGEDELSAVIELRLVKDEHELNAMRHAADVSIAAHLAALAATITGRREADVAAAFAAVLEAHNCRNSFTPIITVRGETLHGQGYGNTLHDGALLLVDGGAEEPGGYACDITRTYPVNGRWAGLQRHLYDTVLRAQRQAVAACVPGRRYRDIHDLTAQWLCEGLVQADLLRGDAVELARRGAHTLFFPHGLGHLIGLDAHDMEDFGDLAGYSPGRKRRAEFGHKFLRLDRDLEAGMTVTIEPGIYFVPAIWQRDDLVSPFMGVVNRPAVEALLSERFGGIRIEDTICVRESAGPENLTELLPKDADALAELVGTAGAPSEV